MEVMENVVEVVVNKLGQLRVDLQEVMKVAACLGQEFDATSIQNVLLQTYVLGQLEQAVQLNLVDKFGANRFKWVHDRIQEAAYSTIDRQSALYWGIGMALKSQLDEEEIEDSEFMTIVHQLGYGVDYVEHKPDMAIELARLNIKAAEMALASHAHVSALRFAKAGIAFLGKDGWSTHYPERRRRDSARIWVGMKTAWLSSNFIIARPSRSTKEYACILPRFNRCTTLIFLNRLTG
jgi:predicted ATPase